MPSIRYHLAIVNFNGVPLPEFEFPMGSLPALFSLEECLKLNNQDDNVYADTEAYFFGELVSVYNYSFFLSKLCFSFL